MNTQLMSTVRDESEILITEALQHRRQRTPKRYEAVAAFGELSALLVSDPHHALRRSLEIARGLCNADTAGLSVLRTNDEGEEIFQWTAVSGAMAAHEGFTTRRDFSLCGSCLDEGATILVSRPERRFAYLSNVDFPMVEVLVVPLFGAARKALGTVWIAHHGSRQFSRNDARNVERLTVELVLAMTLQEERAEQQRVLDFIESQRLQHRRIAAELAAERRQREIAEQSEKEWRQELAFKDAAIREVDHRAKNTLQVAANYLMLQSRTTLFSETSAKLREAYRRLRVLAQLHELLQMNDNGASTVYMPKLLHTTADALRESFAEMSDRVSLRVRADDMTLKSNDAIPLALIANELVTNAYKHAFPKDLCGEISLSLKQDGQSAITLQVIDTGIGRSSEDNSGGMGQKLTRSFAAYLKGEVIFSVPADGRGTIATLTIPQQTLHVDAGRNLPSQTNLRNVMCASRRRTQIELSHS